MPTYEYACKSCGQHIDVVQSFSDDPLTLCPNCGGTLRKVFGNIGIAFKGSGFYKNDSRAASTNGSGRSSGSAAGGTSGSDSSPASTSESTGTGTDAGSGTGSSADGGPASSSDGGPSPSTSTRKEPAATP